MDLFESIKQGVVGFLLFAGNWISPQNDSAELRLESAHKVTPPAWQIALKMEFSLNPQIEQLIDAGVPLNFRFTAISDRADTVTMTRSLRCDVADLTYSFIDSTRGTSRSSKKYPMILLALKDFGSWKFTLPSNATQCHAEAEILYSTVSQLNRSVDMSRIWGHDRLKTTFALAEAKK